MTKLYKSLAVSLAIVFTASFVGRNVKAAVGGTVAAVAVGTIAVVLTHYLCEVVVPAVAETIDDSCAKYRHELETKNYYETLEFQKKIDSMKEEELLKAKDEIKEAILHNQDLLEMYDSSPGSFWSATVDYYEKKIQDYKDQYSYVSLALNVLKSASYNDLRIAEEGALKTNSNAFSELYSDVLENTISSVLDIETNVSRDTGMSLRQIAMKYPEGLSEYFPSLVVKYGAVGCFQDELVTADGSPDPSIKYYFYVLSSDGVKYSYAPYPGVQNQPNKYIESWHNYQTYRFNLNRSSSDFFVKPSIENYFKATADGSFGFADYHIDKMMNPFNKSYVTSSYYEDYDAVHLYCFLFDTYEKALAMSDDFNKASAIADPSEAATPPLIFDGMLTGIEKVIAAQKEALGTEDVDIVINPGLTIDEDGEAVYNPSISVGGVAVSDQAGSGSDSDEKDTTIDIDIADAVEKFETPNSITTKFPFSIPFDIYHLFNVFSAEPVAPRFDMSFDLTTVGAENYEFVIDLSEYGWIANIVRWILYAVFLIGLAILTNKVIGRG